MDVKSGALVMKCRYKRNMITNDILPTIKKLTLAYQFRQNEHRRLQIFV